MAVVTIDLKPANDELRKNGLIPFPVEAITFEAYDDDFVRTSCQHYQKMFQEWAMKHSRP